jgi:hypothetical protein
MSDFRQIQITNLKHLNVNAAYLLFSQVCLLSPNLFQENLSTVALAIIHESIHARLDQAGIWQLPSQKNRIEGLCVKAEIDFIRKYPSTPEAEGWIQNTIQWLASNYPIVRQASRQKSANRPVKGIT